MMIFFIFFLVFIYAIGFVQFANVIFFIIYINQVVKNNCKIVFAGRYSSRIFFLLFMSWITLTTLFYAVISGSIDSRNLTQYFFNFQYIILILGFKYNVKFFETWVFNFSILLTFCILGLIFYYNIPFASLRENEMLISIIPGFPNSAPIALLIALWIAFKQEKLIWFKLFLIIGLIFTGSRGALIGVILIVFYFIYKRIKNSKYFLILLSALFILLITMLLSFLSENELLLTQLTRSYDREDIFNTTMAYVELNPIFGYGGNTIGQLQDVKINFSPTMNWEHTHNWVLEILLRYGIIGLILFLGFLRSIIKNINDFDKKYIFIVFLVLALFQNFIRDFVFIFFLSYFANTSKESRQLKVISEM